MYSRRDFHRTALLSLPLLAAQTPGSAQSKKVAPNASRFGGIQIGVQTYSYRSLRNMGQPLDVAGQRQLIDRIVDSIVQNQVNVCEFWLAFLEPTGPSYSRIETTPAMMQNRETLRKWRESQQPKEIWAYAKDKLTTAGISVHSCMFNFADWISDAEIDYAFEAGKALGTNTVSANCTKKSIKRAAPFADKHKMLLAAHSESSPFDPDIDGMVFADNLEQALTYTPNMRITLDTGHFTAYNGDVLAFLKKHKDRIVNLHLKDRLHNHPQPHTDEDTTEFGKGDAPLKAALQWMKKEKVKFAACIEYEYPGKGTAVEEVAKCLNFAKDALNA
jgi:sugar phosphate isomerase/epimerase